VKSTERRLGWPSKTLLMYVIGIGGVLVSTTLAIKLVRLGEVSYYVLNSDSSIEKAKPGQFGILEKNASFLTHFTGRIVDHVADNEEELKGNIRTAIMKGFEKDGHLLSEMNMFDSERERLIAYMMLRVNGSLPVYKVTSGLPDKLPELLMGKEGNCSHAAFRLLMVLDAFAIKGRAIVWFSPSMTGHIFVDAYDQTEQKAYLLDPSFNLFSTVHSDVTEGYLDILARMTVEEKISALQDRLKSFPFFIRETKGVQQESESFWEEAHLRIRDSVLTALVYEMPAALEHWKKNYPRSIPTTLDQAAYLHGNPGLRKFNPKYSLSTEPLLEIAGIRNPDSGYHLPASRSGVKNAR